MDGNDLMPLTEVAHQLTLSWERAWRLVLRGKLKGERLGGHWFVRRSEMERFARDGAAPQPAAGGAP